MNMKIPKKITPDFLKDTIIQLLFNPGVPPELVLGEFKTQMSDVFSFVTSKRIPVQIPGVSVTNFMKTAINESRKANGKEEMPANEMLKLIREKSELLEIDRKFLSRSLNEGFSGGEKKRNEIFQMAMLQPKLAILDETDSGLDIDAL